MARQHFPMSDFVGEGVEADDLGESENPREFCIFPEGGSLNYDYIVGTLAFEVDGGLIRETRRVSVICVSVVDNKLLVAIPFSCWHRLVRDRKLPPGSFSKAVSLAVGASLEDKRNEVVEGVFVKLWLGFISPEFEACITFQEQTEAPVPFLTEDYEDGFIPSPEALVAVSDEKFSFLSLESGEPGIQAPPQVSEPDRRLAALEEAVIGMKQGIQVLMDRLEKPAAEIPQMIARPKEVPKKPSAGESGVPGLDPQVVRSALQSGVDRGQLEQLSQMMGRFGGKDLGDAPAVKKKLDPLGEVIENQELPGEPGEAEAVPSDPMTHALVKLTNIVDALASSKQKKPRSLAELLDDPYVCRGVQFVEFPIDKQPSAFCSVESVEKSLDRQSCRSVLLYRIPNASRFWCPRSWTRSTGVWRHFSRLGRTLESCAGNRWYSSHFVGRLWSTRCIEKGQGGGGESSTSFASRSYRSSGGGSRPVDTGGGGVIGRKSSDSFVQSSSTPRADRISTHQALGCDLGRGFHAQDKRNRRLCGEASETWQERPETTGSRCSRSERKGRKEGSRSRKRSMESASGGGEPSQLKEQVVSPLGDVEQPKDFREDSSSASRPSPFESKPSVPNALPGSRASSVHPKGWWLSSYRLASRLGGSFSSFIRSFHRHLATPPESVGTASLWPMPLPFVSDA